METITIVGGGIAGLALAAALDPSRFHVTVYEKRPGLPTVGTVLAMWPNAQRALARVGILGQARAVSPVLGSGSIRNAAGEPWITVNGGELIGMSRVDLLRLLDSAVPATVRRVNRQVKDLPAGQGLMVGADGVHSVVRRQVWGAAADARVTSCLALRGTIPAPVDPDAVGEYWGRGDLFGIAASPGGTNWYASWRSDMGPSGIDVAEALEQARQRFEGHAPAIRQVLAAAVPELSLAQRIWTTPPLRSYVRGAAVLVGDAAHAMTPNLGRGACESLVDAVVLADLLNSLPQEKALAAYNRQRRLRTRALSRASAVMMLVALADGAQPLRDRVLNLARRRNARAAVASGPGR
ncbi:FAD-dependent monooxygenase [Pseudarthrobacter sp902506025]|uniref:2-polyprenyl-6-methoxyphenol hydroxylase-like FAD-dependent oxidoreductase n=1 Tax=Pseudarthrobacter defluvii TaxID=410837 RepID=A0ABT9UIA2_9MICC|nr:FAD-dependent monooxygenase [Pseudarthrobacter defluvii]MDQ0119373.1 2-polyprenyl-6-methoxyphenol hydroxylase-like FAD-dependent oxidoreductase [Pseudarthrobacter defluvii]